MWVLHAILPFPSLSLFCVKARMSDRRLAEVTDSSTLFISGIRTNLVLHRTFSSRYRVHLTVLMWFGIYIRLDNNVFLPYWYVKGNCAKMASSTVDRAWVWLLPSRQLLVVRKVLISLLKIWNVNDLIRSVAWGSFKFFGKFPSYHANLEGPIELSCSPHGFRHWLSSFTLSRRRPFLSSQFIYHVMIIVVFMIFSYGSL